MRGLYRRMDLRPLNRPLTAVSLLLASVMPAPARGEGAAAGTAASSSLLPLREKVAWTKSAPDEGSLSADGPARPLNRPLTAVSLLLASVMPSPARGEGAAAGTAASSSLLP